jgi:hypothetical protein
VNIDWVIPCRYVEVHENLATMVGAGVDIWRLIELPQTLQVQVAVRLLATSMELEERIEHPLRSVILDPSGAIIEELESQLEVGGDGVGHPEYLSDVIMAIAMRFEVTEPGTWHFELSVDDSAYRVPMHVEYHPV